MRTQTLVLEFAAVIPKTAVYAYRSVVRIKTTFIMTAAGSSSSQWIKQRKAAEKIRAAKWYSTSISAFSPLLS